MSERRDTPLARQLADEIAQSTPIGIDRYMARCLSDPAHGYYTTRSGIGREGDFTTAPEISQVFGELIGLWAAVVWQQMGSPARVNLVELGPGRGQLIADALRAARILPGFLDAIDLHLCEINPAFRDQQAKQLSQHQKTAAWHDLWPILESVPTIVIANEFLDTIPGTQWQRDADGNWQQLCVGLDAGGGLAFVPLPGQPPRSADLPAESDTNQQVFTHTDYGALANDLSKQAGAAPLAALFIDYGHVETAWGDTLQSVRNHQFEHPLCSPGEADMSVAVDFAAFARATREVGLVTDGPTTQAEFLGQLGITERASKLMAASPGRANDIESGIFRLMSATGMGTRFLAIGVRSPQLPMLPGFPKSAT